MEATSLLFDCYIRRDASTLQLLLWHHPPTPTIEMSTTKTVQGTIFLDISWLSESRI